MRETSFGRMQSLLDTGQVHVDGAVFTVGPGDRVTIPPGTQHKMVPGSKRTPLEGLLWYHEERGRQFP